MIKTKGEIMKNENRKGFTLIELLVVVLIIGILASVALPQYQKAVEKSRLMQQVILVNSIVKAQELYYMANGSFSSDLENLDIDVPKGCSFLSGASDKSYVGCGKYSVNYMHRNQCDVHGSNGSSWNIGTIRYEKDMNIGPCSGGTYCHAQTDDALANSVCKSMGGTNATSSPVFGGFTQYTLP